MPTAPSIILVFIAGIATVITPCVLPILPAVLSGSIGSKLRPLAIVVGMSITFTLMGVLVSAITSFASIAERLRWFAIFFIIGMGVILFDDDINQEYVKLSSYIVNHLPLHGNNQNEGILGGFFLGLSLGIVWIPCVGPILGAVLAFVAESSTSIGNMLHGAVLLLVYSLGVGIPMLIIAYSGKGISKRVEWFMKRGALFKKLSGLVLIIVGLMMLFGIDRYLQAKLLPYFPVLI